MIPLNNPSGPPNSRESNAGGYAFWTQAALDRHLADVRAKEEALREAMRQKKRQEEADEARAKAKKEIQDACAKELAGHGKEQILSYEEKLQEMYATVEGLEQLQTSLRSQADQGPSKKERSRKQIERQPSSNSSASWSRRREKKKKTRKQAHSANVTGVNEERDIPGVQGEPVEQADQAVSSPSDSHSPDHYVQEARHSNNGIRLSEISSYATSSWYSQDDEALPPSENPFASASTEMASQQVFRHSQDDQPITPSKSPFASTYVETISQQASVHMSKRTSAQSVRSSNRSTVRNKGKGKRESTTSQSSRTRTTRRHSSRLVSRNVRKRRTIFSGSSPKTLKLPLIVAAERTWPSRSASDMIRRASHHVTTGLGVRKSRSEEIIRDIIGDFATNAKARRTRSLNFQIGQAISTPDETAVSDACLAGPKKDVQRQASSSSEEAKYLDAPEQTETHSLTNQPEDDGFAQLEDPEQNHKTDTVHESGQSEHTVTAPVEQLSVPEPAHVTPPQAKEISVSLPPLCDASDSALVHEKMVMLPSPDGRKLSKIWRYVVPAITWLAAMLGLCACLVQSHQPLSSLAQTGVDATKSDQMAFTPRSLSIPARFLEPANFTIPNATKPDWHTFTHAQNYTLSVPWPVSTIAAFMDQRNRNQVQHVLFNMLDEMKQNSETGQNETGTVVMLNEIGQPITFPVPGVHDKAILNSFLIKVFDAMISNTSIYSTGISSGNHTSLNSSTIPTSPHLRTQPLSALNQTWNISLDALTRPNATGLFAELMLSATHSLDLNTVCPKMEVDQEEKKCECTIPPAKCPTPNPKPKPKPKPEPSTLPKGSKGNGTETGPDDDVVDSEDEEMETEFPSAKPTILFVRNLITGLWFIPLAAGLFWAGCYVESRVAGLRYEWQWVWGFSIGIVVISLLGSAGLGLGTQALTELIAVKMSG
ncbi:hypothetical protein FB567DRAFT_596567 [Paraphoma chrysanthemicola]|uniref:Uncharacterized protein n=1 Tax=Paraphoma chrysanthemicola TaxID=798071 RepID=A0A8K0QZK0_9PLEO|nr:hypothetical protein FB567DRAFT_596567 [Paraphoma chrysanthemicola]